MWACVFTPHSLSDTLSQEFVCMLVECVKKYSVEPLITKIRTLIHSNERKVLIDQYNVKKLTVELKMLVIKPVMLLQTVKVT